MNLSSLAPLWLLTIFVQGSFLWILVLEGCLNKAVISRTKVREERNRTSETLSHYTQETFKVVSLFCVIIFCRMLAPVSQACIGPISLVFQRCLYPHVRRRCDHVCSRLLEILKGEYHLLDMLNSAQVEEILVILFWTLEGWMCYQDWSFLGLC